MEPALDLSQPVVALGDTVFTLGQMLAAGGVLLALIVLWIVISARRNGRHRAEMLEESRQRTAEAEARMAEILKTQTEMHGRMASMAEIFGTRQQELNQAIHQRFDSMTSRIGQSMSEQQKSTHENLSRLQERLAVIDAAQKNITDLSAQVVQLQDILTNRQARGIFGEVQLQDLVQAALPPSAYGFQVTLGNGKRADCILKLPNPPGSIAIDAKFPLESYHALRNAQDDMAKQQYSRAFAADVLKHVRDIADRYIVPGETAESALMFIPSEAVYAELHANFPDTVEKSWRARVWIVSPTTLMATLNTVRAVLKDATMREQAGVIQTEVHHMLEDVARLDDRVGALQKHFGQAEEDLRKIRISTDKVTKRGEKIEEIELGEGATPEEISSGAEIHRLGSGQS